MFPVSAPTRAWLSGRAGNREWGYKVLGTGNPRAPPTQAGGQSATTENRREEGTRVMDL